MELTLKVAIFTVTPSHGAPSPASHFAVGDLDGLIADRRLGLAPLVQELLGAGRIGYGDLDDVLGRRQLDELALAFNPDRAAGRLEIADLLLGGRDLAEEEAALGCVLSGQPGHEQDRKSTRLNSSHVANAYAVFCWKKKAGM